MIYYHVAAATNSPHAPVTINNEPITSSATNCSEPVSGIYCYLTKGFCHFIIFD